MNPSAHLLPADLAAHTVESLYAEHGAPRLWIYWLVLLGVIGALASSRTSGRNLMGDDCVCLSRRGPRPNK